MNISGTQEGHDYLMAEATPRGSLPIRDLRGGTNRRYFSPVPTEGPREVAPAEGTSPCTIYRTGEAQPRSAR